MTQFYTYLYSDIDGTPIYAGKGQKKRAFDHLKKKSHLGSLLRKRLADGHKIEPMISYCTNEQEALDLEIFWISLFGRADKKTGTLFNLTDGGDGGKGVICSNATRTKLSLARKDKIMSAETKLKLSIAKKARPVLICPHCNLASNSSKMSTHHFEFCKKKSYAEIIENKKQKWANMPLIEKEKILLRMREYSKSKNDMRQKYRKKK